MPSWQWSYPYGGTDTATVLFDAAPADAVYHWRAPHQDVPQPRQVFVETADGGMRVYTLAQVGRLIVLRFAGLPEGSDADDLALYGWRGMLKFLEAFTNFGGDTFGFYGHESDAEEVEVRCVRGIETFLLAQGRYDGQIVLREEVI